MTGLFLREQFLIERGEDFHSSVVGNSDIAGSVGAPISEGDQTGMGKRETTAAAGARRRSKMVSNLFESAIDGIETDLGIPLIVVADIDAAAVGSPLRFLDIAIELIGEGMRIGAVTIREVKLGGLMALVTIIEASVSD